MKRTPSHISQVIFRIQAAWSEMGYAQRRLFEIRTGIPVDRARDRRTNQQIKELETLYGAGELPSIARWPYVQH